MITKARIKDLVQQNLRDERCTAAALFIQELIERDRFGGGIDQYRIKDLSTDEWVTDLDLLIDGILEDQIEIQYPYEGERLQTDRVSGFLVVLKQYQVVWGAPAHSDKKFNGFFDFASQQYFQFHMAYMNDMDTDLPLKISHTKLVSLD